MAEEITEVKEAKGPGAKNPLLTLLVLLNCILMGTVAYFQYQAHVKSQSSESVYDAILAFEKSQKEAIEGSPLPGEGKDTPGVLKEVPRFVANLAQGDGPRRFLSLGITLKLSTDSKDEEIVQRMPQIKDAVISIINAKRPEDLMQAQGKHVLKEEIKASINSFLINGSVVDIYYTEFQIQ
jgi:flagellar FliL protein